MAKVGIGEALIGNVVGWSAPRGTCRFSVRSGGVEHAVYEAKRLGIKIGMFNCPGWGRSGGPRVGSKHVIWSAFTGWKEDSKLLPSGLLRPVKILLVQ